MRTAWRIGMMMAGSLSGGGEVRGESLTTCLFTARDDTGRVLSGVFTQPTDARPTFLDQPFSAGPVGRAEYTGSPFFLQVEIAGIVATFATGMDGPFVETIVWNDTRFGSAIPVSDALIIVGPQGLRLVLVDDDATAFDRRDRLPGALDLDDFETRMFMFSAGARGVPPFSGTIDSLTWSATAITPEPSTLALVGPAALLALAGWRWRRRKAG